MYACACVGMRSFSEYTIFLRVLLLFRKGSKAALVSGEVWRSLWLCMVMAFQSCSALAQSGSCSKAGSFTQMHAIHVQGEVPEFAVSPWRITCIWQLGIVYSYV